MGGGVGGEQVIPESRRRWEEETERTHHPSITTTPPTLSSRHGGTYNATPHGSLAALEVRGQSHVVRGHHGRAHQIPLRGRGETQTCDTHTHTHKASHISLTTIWCCYFSEQAVNKLINGVPVNCSHPPPHQSQLFDLPTTTRLPANQQVTCQCLRLACLLICSKGRRNYYEI